MGLYLGKEKISNLSVGQATSGVTNISDETTINISGILKGENNKIIPATPGVDYVVPGDSTVTSVNGQTGAVILSASDIGAQSTITVNGILKGDGAGGIGAAMPGTDYLTEAPVTSVNGKTGEVKLVKADVGLSQVANITQYSVKNPPPYPVTSVNGKTGDVTVSEVPSVTASDNGKVATVVNGVWSTKHPTTYSSFRGASASAEGGMGLVPSPKKGQQNRYLKGDGTWADVLPQVAASDNGKFLRVVNGAWAVAEVDNASGVSF